MKNIITFWGLLVLSFPLFGQTNTEVIGKVVTDSIQIKAGATSGHVLQSSDGVGLGLWVAPSIFHDNLGDHLATTSLNMSCFPIDSLDVLNFKNGSAIAPAGSNLLSTKTSINFACIGDLFDLDTLSFCTAGAPGGVVLTSIPGVGVPPMMGAPTNELVLTSPAGPVVALGIGGPANPTPVGPPPASTSVLFNAGAIPLPAPPAAYPGIFSLGVFGDAWAFDWWAFSDERMKKDIIPVTSMLEKIRNLNPVSYHMNTEKFPDRNFDESQKIGFLAQDLVKVAPELVRINTEGYMMVNYDGLIPILASGIKEMDEKMDSSQESLAQEIANLKAENQMLVDRMEQLEEMIKNQKPTKRQRRRSK